MGDYSSTELGTCPVGVELSFGLHYALGVCLKTQTHSALVPSRVPALRQLIPSITLGLCFLGHPTPP